MQEFQAESLMSEIKNCPKCGVPEQVTRDYLWLDHGDIVQKAFPATRFVLAESDNIDPLFHYMERLIDSPIDDLVITAAREIIRIYLSRLIPDDSRKLICEKKADPRLVIEELLKMSLLMGVGIQELIDMRYEGDGEDYFLIRVVKPFSLLLQTARMAGCAEALFGTQHNYAVREIAHGEYEITIFPSPHSLESRSRIRPPEYRPSKGVVDLERCQSCGGPARLSVYSWNAEEGIIMDENIGRRTVMIGSSELDLVFKALEEELGPIAPRLAVEALKRFTKENPYSLFDWTTIEEFQDMLAVRGVGYLKDMEISRKGLSMRIENCVLPLMLVGIMQGVFEKALKHDSIVEWYLDEKDNLDMNIISLSG
jgi:hypothetical protein